MSDNTKIEWTDATVNAVNGCSVLSPGCTNCYAMRLAGTRLRHHPSREGLTIDTKAGPVWNGTTKLNETALLQPLRWKRPRRIFWNAHGDLFHDSVPDEWIDRCFAVMALTPQHQHQVLTKRSARMREYMTALLSKKRSVFRSAGEGGIGWRTTDLQCAFTGVADPDAALGAPWRPLPNVWLGVSVEDQTRADERRENLRATPAAVRFVSYEPALEVVDWSGWEFLDWLISGGESGNNARYVDYAAFMVARDWCAGAGVAYFHKQNGVFDANGMKVGKKAAGRLLDGVTHDGIPG